VGQWWVGLSHVPLLSGYDEPETLSYQITLVGPISPDGRQRSLEPVAAFRIQDSQVGGDVLPFFESDMGVTDGPGTSDGTANAGCRVCR